MLVQPPGLTFERIIREVEKQVHAIGYLRSQRIPGNDQVATYKFLITS